MCGVQDNNVNYNIDHIVDIFSEVSLDLFIIRCLNGKSN